MIVVVWLVSPNHYLSYIQRQQESADDLEWNSRDDFIDFLSFSMPVLFILLSVQAKDAEVGPQTKQAEEDIP